MIGTVFITRPLLASGGRDQLLWRRAGFKVENLPFINIKFLDIAVSDVANYQAVITTSAMGIRALSKLTLNRKINLLCVGNASKNIAQSLNFEQITVFADSGLGNANTLLQGILGNINPNNGPILYLAASVTAGDLAKSLTVNNYQVKKVVAYEAILNKNLRNLLGTFLARHYANNYCLRGGMTFYSKRTALAFKNYCSLEGYYTPEQIPGQVRGQINLGKDFYFLCLSEAIAEVVRSFSKSPVIIASTTGELIANLKEKLRPNRNSLF